MSSRNLRQAIGRPLMIGILVTSAVPAMAGEPVKMVARYADRMDKMEVLPGSQPTGRMVYSALVRGSTKETQGDGLFDGAERVTRANWDLTQGTGFGSGTLYITKDGDTLASQWTGACTTMPGKDGKPFTYCAGGWSFIPGSGTGRFAGVIGGGSWWGKPNPDGGFDGGGEGYYQR